MPKHVRCEYNERDPFCSYASSNAPISPRRGSIRAWCLHLNEATSRFQLSRDPRTFFALDKALENLTFAQNVCRGSVNFMVFALMGFPYESAPPLPKWPLRSRSGGASSAILMKVTLPCFTTSIFMHWSRPCLARLECGIHTLGSFGS